VGSVYHNRLSEKYTEIYETAISKKKYEKIIQQVFANNNKTTNKKIVKITNQQYKEQLKKLGKEKAKTIKLPDINTIVSEDAELLRRSKKSSKQISDTLRSQLERDLRNTLKEFDSTGEKRIEIQRGKATGKINPKLIESFQSKIKQTFESRTKRDKKLGTSPYVKGIAVTEVRSTINSLKQKYNEKLLEENPNLEMTKTWLHNRSLSEVPRKSHMAMNGIVIPVKEKFEVGRDDGSGKDYMARPHDPTAPLGQICNCNCDIVFKARFKKLKQGGQ